MPLSGGSADKIGNRYEAWWTVLQLARMLNERIDAIWLEPIGNEGDKIEFRLTIDGNNHYHQVKRQQSAQGNWSLATLEAKGVLSGFIEKLSVSSAKCVFVSTQDANELRELADRSRQANSLSEFLEYYLKTNKGLEQNYSRLQGYWNHTDHSDTFNALRRIEIKTLEESILRDYLKSELSFAVEGDPNLVANELFIWATNNVHKECTAHELWNYLNERGYHRRNWGNDPHVLAAVEACNNRYLQPIKDRAISDSIIPRSEIVGAGKDLRSEARSNLIIVGEAGIGKSTALVELLDGLEHDGIPLLAFRIDNLEPTATPEKLGEDAGLPGSPATVLAHVSKGKPCVLVIDQLDAVSMASGRNTTFYDCIDEIIRQASAYPNMRLVVACRRFDLDNDSRFRRLVKNSGAKEITISRLSDDDLNNAVSGLGIDPNKLTSGQRTLLSLPIHLSLLAEVVELEPRGTLNFETANELFELFWRFKAQQARERIGHLIRWNEAIDTLALWMSNHQRLSAPRMILNDYDSDGTRNLLESEHIIVRNGPTCSFFHESFFDYAFARSFVAREESLAEMLLKDEQHLFRRAQVRQILLYKRAFGDRSAYLNDVQSLLNDSNIRYHIQQLVIDLLGGVPDPMDQEWEILLKLQESAYLDMQRAVRRAIENSGALFQFVDNRGFIEQLLSSGEEDKIDFALRWMWLGGRKYPERVVRLAKPYVGASNEWNRRIHFVLNAEQVASNRDVLDLVLALIAVGAFDSGGWQHIEHIVEDAPAEWRSEVIAGITAHLSDIFVPNETLPLNAYDNAGWLVTTAKEEPRIFVNLVLPQMLKLLEAARSEEHRAGLHYDSIWNASISYRKSTSFRSSLLEAMQDALALCAKEYPDEIRPTITSLANRHEFIAQFLVEHAMAANGEAFADQAIEHLCSNDELLWIGYIDSARYISRQLITSASPHCSENLLRDLESCIMNYYPEHEQDRKEYRAMYPRHGRDQYILLQGISEARCSKPVVRRLQELERKFGKPTSIEPLPGGTMAKFVGSPIPLKAAEKMSDEQWIQAIEAYVDERPSGGFSNWLKGGSHELSQVLEEQTKKDPERFIKVGLLLPDNTNPCYFGAILRGLQVVGPSLDLVSKFCQKCHELPNRPCGRWIASAFNRRGEEDIPTEILEILEWYTENDPDPSEESWQPDPETGKAYYSGKVFSAGLNSVRGHVCHSMAMILDVERAKRFLPLLERIVHDPSVSVRSCIAAILTQLLRYDRDNAVRLFINLCEADDALLETHYCEEFLSYGIHTHYRALQHIIERMLRSSLDGVRAAGARQITLASLTIPDAASLVGAAITGDLMQRTGVAKVYAVNLGIAEIRTSCMEGLEILFNDESEEVRKTAARCFQDLDGNTLAELQNFLHSFVQSPAFLDDPTPLLHALEESTADITEITCTVCEKFIDVFRDTIGDTRTAIAADGHTVRDLVLRIYAQASSPSIRARCLNIIDGLYRYNSLSIEGTLEEFER